MTAIYWILEIGCALLIICISISYRLERNENEQKLKKFIENRESSRDLTNEELKLLEPFMTNKETVRPYILHPLIDHKVSVVQGPCIRHSLLTQRRQIDYYYEIGNIELFFPYNLDLYLSEYNIVEVVFTNKYAYVLSVNNCSIQFAFENYDPDRKKPIEIPESYMYLNEDTDKYDITSENSNLNSSDINDNDNKNDKLNKVDVQVDYEPLYEREETPLEIKTRNRGNYGILTSLCLTLATIFFMREWSAGSDQILATLVIDIACFGVAVFFIWHKPKRNSRPQQVETIKVNTFNKDPSSDKLIVGQKTNVSYPKYWSQFLPEVSKKPTEMDIYGYFKILLRCGNTLSINREVEQFGAPKMVVRNKVLFFVGSILAIVIYFFSDPINNSFSAYRYYSNQLQTWQVNDLTTLNNSNIKQGDLIDITINGVSCDVKDEDKDKNNGNKCHRLAIKDKPLENESNQIMLSFDTINKIFDDNFVESIEDNELLLFRMYQQEMVKEYNMKNTGSYNSSFYRAKPILKLKNLGQMVIDINKVCNIFELECQNVKFRLTQLYYKEGFHDQANWDELVTRAEKFPTFNKIVEKSIVDKFIFDLKKMKKETLSKLTNTVSDYQFNGSGVDVTLIGNSYIELPQLYNINNPISDDDLKLSLDHYYKILTNESETINLVGLVGGVSHREDSSISQLKLNVKNYYKVDLEKLFSLASPVIIDIIMFVIMVLVALINGGLVLYKTIFNRRRLKQIIKYYSDRVVHYYG